VTLTLDLDLEIKYEWKGNLVVSHYAGCGCGRCNIKEVVHVKPLKKCCQTFLSQTNKLTNIQTHKRSNINGFRHLIKYGVVSNFFEKQIL